MKAIMTQPVRRDAGAVLPILLVGLSQILVPLAIWLVAAPLAWIGERTTTPNERPPCVERYVDDGDRPVTPPSPECDPAPRNIPKEQPPAVSTSHERR